MRKTSIIMAAAVCLVILTMSVCLAKNTVYVKNKPLNNTMTSQNEVYVDVSEFLTKGGYSYKITGDALEIWDKPGGRPAITAIPKKYSYNGRVFSPHTFMVSGKPYAMAKALASGLGLTMRYTDSVKAYDYFNVANIPPARDKAVSKDPETPKETPKEKDPVPVTDPASLDVPVDKPLVKDKDKDKEPEKKEEAKPKEVQFKGDEIKDSVIQPKNTFFYEWRTGEVRGEVIYENTSKFEITKISVTMNINDSTEKDGDKANTGTLNAGKPTVSGYEPKDEIGKPLFSDKHNVGTLKAGDKSEKYSYLWLNPGNYNIVDDSFTYEITYMQPPELDKDNKENKDKKDK